MMGGSDLWEPRAKRETRNAMTRRANAILIRWSLHVVGMLGLVVGF